MTGLMAASVAKRRVAAGVSAPAPAVAAGYTELTFSDEFDSLSTVNTGTSADAAKKWSNWIPFEGSVMPGSCFTQGSWTDSLGAASSSVLHINQNRWNYNQGLYTVDARNNLGFSQQYGYFEARFCHADEVTVGAVTMPATPAKAGVADTPSAACGWPSWWSLARRHVENDGNELVVNSVGRYLELDFHEYYDSANQTAEFGNRFTGTVHDWPSSARAGESWRNTDGNQYGDHMTGGPSRWHTYACLWTPGLFKWYLDGVEQNQIAYSAGAAPVPNNVTTGPGGTYVMPSGTFNVADLDTQGIVLALGTGNGYPMHIDWVRVWGSSAPTLITGNRLSLADQSLESGVGNWGAAALGGDARTVAASQAQAKDGTGSFLMVRSGAGTGWIGTWGTLTTIAPGDVFKPYAWVRANVAGLSASVDLETKLNGAYVGGSYMTEVSIPINTWTKVTAATYTIPAGVNQYQPLLRVHGATTANQGAYFDTIYYGNL